MQALQKSSASCNIYWLGDWLYPITILLHSHVVNMINNTPSCYFYVLYFGSVQFILCSDQTTTIVGNGWIFSNKKLRPQLCVCDIWIELSWIERGPKFRLSHPDLIFFTSKYDPLIFWTTYKLYIYSFQHRLKSKFKTAQISLQTSNCQRIAENSLIPPTFAHCQTYQSHFQHLWSNEPLYALGYFQKLFSFPSTCTPIPDSHLKLL